MLLYKCRLSLCMVNLMFFLASIQAAQSGEPAVPEYRLSGVARNALIGACASTADVALNQPFFCIKNLRQEGKAWSEIPFKDPRALYRGACVGLVRSAPMAAIQLSVQEHLKQVVPGPDFISSATRAFLAGITSTTFGAPMEVIILHRQLHNKKTLDTIKSLIEEGGCRSFMRGIFAKWVRGGVFGVGFLAVYPRIEDDLLASTGSMALATAGAAGLAGSSTVVITHPFDTIATRMQSDYARAHFQSVLHTAKVLYQTEGISSLYRGLGPRALLIASAIGIMSKVRAAFGDDSRESVIIE